MIKSEIVCLSYEFVYNGLLFSDTVYIRYALAQSNQNYYYYYIESEALGIG